MLLNDHNILHSHICCSRKLTLHLHIIQVHTHDTCKLFIKVLEEALRAFCYSVEFMHTIERFESVHELYTKRTLNYGQCYANKANIVGRRIYYSVCVSTE